MGSGYGEAAMSTGTYLRIWESDGGNIAVMSEHEPSIDAAVGAWLDTSRDSLIRLTCITGEDYVTKASRVTAWLVSTPEGRAASTAHQKDIVEEERANRLAVGLPWTDAET